MYLANLLLHYFQRDIICRKPALARTLLRQMDRQTDRQTDRFLVHNKTSDTHYIADELTRAIVLIKDVNLPRLPEPSNSMQE